MPGAPIEIYATCTVCHSWFTVEAELIGRRELKLSPHREIKRGQYFRLEHRCGGALSFIDNNLIFEAKKVITY